MQATPPPAPPVVQVQRASNEEALILMGVILKGAAADIDRAQAAAQAARFRAGRVPDETPPELMIGFAPGTPRAAALEFFRRATAGEFGALRVEVIAVPVLKAVDGIDMDREVEVLEPGAIKP